MAKGLLIYLASDITSLETVCRSWQSVVAVKELEIKETVAIITGEEQEAVGLGYKLYLIAIPSSRSAPAPRDNCQHLNCQ